MSITLSTPDLMGNPGNGTCDRCGATCTLVTLHHGRYSCTECRLAVAQNWIVRTQFVTLTATTEGGARFTVWKRPGRPSVVIHPDGSTHTGHLSLLADGSIRVSVSPAGGWILQTAPVVGVHVMEN